LQRKQRVTENDFDMTDPRASILAGEYTAIKQFRIGTQERMNDGEVVRQHVEVSNEFFSIDES
jgi:hypothetical protein